MQGRKASHTTSADESTFGTTVRLINEHQVVPAVRRLVEIAVIDVATSFDRAEAHRWSEALCGREKCFPPSLEVLVSGAQKMACPGVSPAAASLGSSVPDQRPRAL